MVLTAVPIQYHARSSLGLELHLNLDFNCSVHAAELLYKMHFIGIIDLVLCRTHNRKESGSHCWEASKTIISSFILRTLDSLVTCESVKSRLVILLHKAASLCMSAFDTARF